MEEMTKIDYTVQQNTNTHMLPVTRKRIKEVWKKQQRNDGGHGENDNKIQWKYYLK